MHPACKIFSLFGSHLLVFSFGCAGSLLLLGRLSLVAANGGYSVVVLGLLIVVASFVAEQGLLNFQASVELGLSSCGT